MIIYITKYATTKGILEAEEDDKGVTSPPEMAIVKRGSTGYTSYFYKGEWFTDFSLALRNAERRHVKELERLKIKAEKIRRIDLTKVKKF